MIKKRPANPIKDEEKILDIQDYLKDKSERNYMLFITGISTGYRAGDLVNLRVRDVKEALDEGFFLILEGKKKNTAKIRKINMKPRRAAINTNLSKKLTNYIKGKKDYEFLFKSRKGLNKNITVSHVSRILSIAGMTFGLKHITAHSMRKTFAYRMYIESGKDLTTVREMLGQSSNEMAKLYIGLDEEIYDKYSESMSKLIR